uniref:Uncharacterized protein n=1 Tax=Picea glauca TaxID=3330 RepID=A0A101LV85_PICGL|nr:hypothetical protein ABT39_MTgene2080 [Picea glauca]QHR87102.1 hypothetical protein Q903MT_gene1111 [Picea sitchensis]
MCRLMPDFPKCKSITHSRSNRKRACRSSSRCDRKASPQKLQVVKEKGCKKPIDDQYGIDSIIGQMNWTFLVVKPQCMYLQSIWGGLPVKTCRELPVKTYSCL